jgi:hypothetical protein
VAWPNHGILQIGQVLHSLHFQAFQIDLRNSSSLVPLTIDIQDVIVVGKVLFGQTEKRLLLKRLHEGHTQIEKQTPFKVGLTRCDLSRIPGAFQAQFPFVPAFVQITD